MNLPLSQRLQSVLVSVASGPILRKNIMLDIWWNKMVQSEWIGGRERAKQTKQNKKRGQKKKK